MSDEDAYIEAIITFNRFNLQLVSADSVKNGEVITVESRQSYNLRHNQFGESEQFGVIYIVECCGRIKIGLTTKRLRNRIAAMATGCPMPITVLDKAVVEQPRMVEAILHRRFRKYRYAGEWFYGIDAGQVIKALNKYRRQRVASPESGRKLISG